MHLKTFFFVIFTCIPEVTVYLGHIYGKEKERNRKESEEKNNWYPLPVWIMKDKKEKVNEMMIVLFYLIKLCKGKIKKLFYCY